MSEDTQELARLWPEDIEEVSKSLTDSGPNTELAINLLAAGCTPNYIAKECGFSTIKEARAFCADLEVRQAVRIKGKERQERVGARALVSLESLLAKCEGRKDLRSVVLLIRTGLEAGGMWRKDLAPPVKQVQELSVSELNELIRATREELEARRLPVAKRLIRSHSEQSAA